jgi:hypothetical protein
MAPRRVIQDSDDEDGGDSCANLPEKTNAAVPGSVLGPSAVSMMQASSTGQLYS